MSSTEAASSVSGTAATDTSGTGTAATDGDGVEAPPGPPTYRVGELCDRVAGAIGSAFDGEVWVEGAISGLTRSGNGHVYFDLIDPTDEPGRRSTAVLPVALFASNRTLVNRILRRVGGMRMHDGVEIRIRGQVAYYPPQGRVQLVMSLIDPQYTLGQMVQARMRLLNALSDEGLLEANSSLTLTPLPLQVGLITSDQSAAYFDFVREITASPYPFSITLIDARVQGEEAAAGLRAAVTATAEIADLDVVVLVRGGGARTDLSAFDDEGLARAIAACGRPVVVGVGHEVDRSVADEVAHTSTKTPTAAARFLIDVVQRHDAATAAASARLADLAQRHLEWAERRLVVGGARLSATARRVTDREGMRLDDAGRRLMRAPQRVGDREGPRLDQAARRLGRAPQRVVERERPRLDEAERRLAREPERITDRDAARLALATARLAALDPVNALRRGWTITYGHDGRPVRSPDQVTDGDRLRTVTADGEVFSIVDGLAAGPTDSSGDE